MESLEAAYKLENLKEEMPLSTGNTRLDSLLECIRPGDNIVWHVPSTKEYTPFAKSFIQHCAKQGFKTVYVSIDNSLKYLIDKDRIEVFDASKYDSPAELTKQLSEFIKQRGLHVHYIFDNLTALKQKWKDDETLADFFQIICPLLYDLKTVAYFSLHKDAHKTSVIAKIRDTAQIMIDVSSVGGDTYIKPLKVWDRYTEDMFKPHVFKAGTLETVRELDVEGYAHQLEKKVKELNKIKAVVKESEEKYCRLFDYANDSIFISDPKTLRILDVNENAAKRLGYTKKELLKKTVAEIAIYNPENPSSEKIVRDLKKTGSVVFEHTHQRKDGTEMPIEVSSRLIKYGGRQVIQSFVRDITKRKQMEEELQESEVRFRTSVESMLDCFGIYSAIRDESGHIIDFQVQYVNEAACESNQMTREAQVGKRLLELLPAHRETGLFNEYCKLVETGKPLIKESLIYEDEYKKQHLKRAFDIRATKLGDGFAAAWRDITKRKQLEEALRKSEEQLEQKVKERTQELKTINTELFLLQRINEMLNRGTLEEVFQTIVEGLAYVFGYDLTAIHLLDEEKKHLVLKAYYAPSKIARKIEDATRVKPSGLVIPLYKGSILNEIVKKKKLVITPDVAWVVRSYTDKKALQALAPVVAKLSGVKWGMGVPLIVDGKVIGVIGCGGKKELTVEDADRMAFFGNHASVAIKKVQMGTSLLARANELSELKEFNENIIDTAPVAIFTTDKKGNINFANPTHKKMMGWKKPDEGIGLNVLELPTLKALGWDKLFKKALRGKPFEIYGKKYTSVFGKTIYLNGKCTPLKDADGKIEGLLTMVEDVTERKKAEEFLDSIVDCSADAIITTNAKMIITSWNRGAEQLYDYKAEEIIGKPIDVLYPKERKEERKTWQKDILESKTLRNITTKSYNRKGDLIDISLSLAPLKDAAGQIIGTVGVSKNITERKRAEEEIKLLKEFNEGIVQRMDEGILMLDPEGYITFANPRCERMLGHTREELIGKPWTKLLAKDYAKKANNETTEWIKGAKTRFECALTSKPGNEIPVMISATPFQEDESVTSILLVLVDITESKARETKIKEEMLKYRVQNGNVYLVEEKSLSMGMDVFQDLTACGCRGLILTRTPPNTIHEKWKTDAQVIWLSKSETSEPTVPPEFRDIERLIEDFLMRDSVVLLDRIDYLIFQKGFNECLNFIQHLAEVFYLSKAILIITLDPDVLDAKEIALLEKETMEVKPKTEPLFPENTFEVLEYIWEQNREGKKPRMQLVQKIFGISRPTASKKIKILKNMGVITDTKIGRTRLLEITEKGKLHFK